MLLLKMMIDDGDDYADGSGGDKRIMIVVV